MQPRSTASLGSARSFFRPRIIWSTVLVLILAGGVMLPQTAIAQVATQTPPSVIDGTAKLVQRANPDQLLRVVLGLERPNPDQEEEFLRDVHTKGTKEYRHFLTQEEWNARFAPSPQDEQAVVDWATSQGLKVTNRYPGSDPDMVAAGGTALSLNADSTYNHEVAWTGGTTAGSCPSPTNDGGGGGGCSSKFSAPGYQGNNPHCGVGSRSVPDISLKPTSGPDNFRLGRKD